MNMTTLQPFDMVIGKLDAFIRKYYKNQAIRGILYFTGITLLFFLLLTVAEYYGHFDTTIRTALFWTYIAGITTVLIRLVVIPLLHLYRIGAILTQEQAAVIVGRHFPEVKDKLLNTLQLKKMDGSDGVNRRLIEASIRQKTEELRPIPFTGAIKISENKKYIKYAAVPLSVLLLLLFAAPSILRDGTGRLLAHRTYFAKLAPFRFEVQNDILEAVQHEDFRLDVKLTGDEIPEQIFVEADGNTFALSKDKITRFHYTFRNVQKDVRFRLSGNGFQSAEFTLKTLPKPVILNFEILLDYPDYTGRKDERLQNIGDLDIPAGTQVKWLFNTVNTEGISMRFQEEEAQPVQKSENSFAFSKRMLESGLYTVSSFNRLIRNEDSVTYQIQVAPDQYPHIEVAQRVDSLSDKYWYFLGLIRDDYGFGKLAFHYEYLNSKDPEKSGRKTQFLAVEKSATQARFYYEWDASQLDIQPGEELAYYFEVWDNDAVNGSKSARTQKVIFKAPTLEELAEKNDQVNDKIKKDLESSIRDVKALQKDLNNLNKRMLEKKELGWEETKKIQDVLEKQKELQNKMEEIKRDNKKNQSEQQEYKPVQESLLEKQQQLNKLFDELMTEEMRELFRKMEELLQDISKEKMQEMMDQMKLSEKELEKELDRSLEIFKQLEFEQKLNDIQEKMEQLAAEEEKLSEESKNKKNEEEKLIEKQEEIKKDFESVKEEMEKLEEMNKELENPHGIPDQEDESKEAGEQMEKSQQELKDGKRSKASESQKNASEKMKKMADAMAAMQAQMQGESMELDMQALRELLENLVQLSFDQEALMEELKKIDRSSPSFVRINQEQKKLKDDAKMIEDSLFALSKRVIQLESIVNREISAINMNMEKAIGYLSEAHMGQNYESKAAERQQYVMTSVNNLALILDEVAQQMQAQMQAQGSGSCSKPGESKGKKPGNKPSISSLKKLQEQLNKQIEQLKKEGQNPGGKDGRGPMSEQLARMAAQQEAIRNELQKINQELNKDGKKPLGDMDGLMKEMEETEKDLVNRQLSRETILRQQEIMTRLLESEKAERERDMEEKRESKEGKNMENSNLGDFLKYKTMKLREVELLKTVPPTLSPYYKRKVNDYFNQYNKG